MRVAMSYALFGDPSSFEFPWYLRGLYFNARMNQILYPGFHTWVNVQNNKNLDTPLVDFFDDLMALGIVQIVKYHNPAPRCEAMLWRMYPILGENPHYYGEDITHVICRDADSVSTYREACCVYEWLQSDHAYHAINDNAAHGGLMGGLVGFKVDDFKKDTKYTSFEQMIKGVDLSKHGSDQNWMNRKLLPIIKNKLMFHNLKGAGAPAFTTKTDVSPSKHVNPKLWVTDLISRYIGSAGVIDFELLRFFRSQSDQKKFDSFENKHSEICYWAK